MEMHNLTLANTNTPRSLSTIIGLGLKFIPSPQRQNINPTTSLSRLNKDFKTKVYFSGKPLQTEEEFNPKLHVESEWCPKSWEIPKDIHDCLDSFRRQILKTLRKRTPKSTNLLPFQTRALRSLAIHTDVLVVNYDKNLGPTLINTPTYIERAFTDHLESP